MKNYFFIFCCFFIVLAGCRTIPKNVDQGETNKDVQSALTSIATAVSERELTNAEVRNFEKQIQKDPEAQSAVRVISNSMSGKNVRIKYCPLCGRRYDAKFEECPIDKTKLEWVE